MMFFLLVIRYFCFVESSVTQCYIKNHKDPMLDFDELYVLMFLSLFTTGSRVPFTVSSLH